MKNIPSKSATKLTSSLIVAGAVWCVGGLLIPGAGGAEPAPLSPDNLAVLREGDLCKLETAVADGLPVHGRDARGNTPLMLAAVHGDVASLQLLLQNGANVNATNLSGATALMRAAVDHRKVALLLEHGATVDARSKFGNTALILAARPAGSYPAVKQLLEHGADARDTTHFGASALMAAVAGGNAQTTELLLQRGADPNAQSGPGEPGFVIGGGRTPLMWAAFRGNETVLQQLIGAGTDPNADGEMGTPLGHAAWADQTGTARLLLQHGAKVSQIGRMDGYSALHWAASTEGLDDALVKLLLQNGADPDLPGGEPVDAFLGKLPTPLMLAQKRGDTRILSALRAASAAAPAAERQRVVTPPARELPDRLDSVLLREAIGRAVPPLQRTALESKRAFVRHSSRQDCTSCHQQYLPMAAVALARKQGVPVDRRAEDELHRIVEVGEMKDFEFDWQPLFHPDPVMTKGYTLLGYALAEHPADELTDAAVHHLAAIQGGDGRWYNNLPRPPIQSGDISATALAIHALQRYPLPGRRVEFAQRVERARRWLREERPENTDSQIYQLLGLAWSGEPASQLQSLARALIREQRADGGWAQLPGLHSDAYATGQAIFALRVGAGLGEADPAVERGRRWLLRNQLADGTWHVARRAFPFQPTMSSGFPHGRDSWLSAAGTSWAVMALSLPDQSRPLVSAIGCD